MSFTNQTFHKKKSAKIKPWHIQGVPHFEIAAPKITGSFMYLSNCRRTLLEKLGKIQGVIFLKHCKVF